MHEFFGSFNSAGGNGFPLILSIAFQPQYYPVSYDSPNIFEHHFGQPGRSFALIGCFLVDRSNQTKSN